MFEGSPHVSTGLRHGKLGPDAPVLAPWLGVKVGVMDWGGGKRARHDPLHPIA